MNQLYRRLSEVYLLHKNAELDYHILIRELMPLGTVVETYKGYGNRVKCRTLVAWGDGDKLLVRNEETHIISDLRLCEITGIRDPNYPSDVSRAEDQLTNFWYGSERYAQEGYRQWSTRSVTAYLDKKWN